MSIDKAGLYNQIVNYSNAFDAMTFVLSLTDYRSFLSVALSIGVQLVLFFFSRFSVCCLVDRALHLQAAVFVSPRFFIFHDGNLFVCP